MSVSKRLMDLIESIEPGVHQFVPVQVYQADSVTLYDTLYYWNITTVIDAVNPETGGVKTIVSGQPIDGTHSWTVADSSKLAVHKDRIAGRAAWRDVRLTAHWFVSDALIEGMRAAGMEGWVLSSVWAEI